MTVETLLSFLAAATLVIIVPGPATLFVVASAQRSIRGAAAATAGIVAGDLLLITLAGLGFAALVARWPGLLLFLKIAGALYVGWLGIGLLRSRPDDAPERREEDGRAGFLKGLLITLTNPKPILFFGAFFPMFIDAGTRSWMGSFYLLGLLFQMVNLTYFAAVVSAVRLLGRSAGAFRRPALPVRTVSGCGLLLCGLLILGTSLFQS